MNPKNPNLLHSLFNDTDENDHTNDAIGLDIKIFMYESLNIDDICKYHESNNYTTAVPTNCSDYINVLHINARSLNKNYDLVISFMKSLPKLPDILCVSETWLNSTNVHLHGEPCTQT